MLLSDVARTSREIAAASGRNEKTALLAGLFRAAEPAEAPLVVSYLAGAPPQRRTGLGHRTLSAPPPPAAAPRLTVPEVDAALERIAQVAGKGAQAERKRLLDGLLAAATAEEQRFLYRLLTGELRQGALDALAVEGLAEAVGVPAGEVRRAVMYGGSLGAVAREVLADGPGALAGFRLRVGRPVRPMLARSAATVAEALERLGPCAVEEKLDGIRAQVHIDGPEVTVYTRTLDEITGRLPEITEAARELAAGSAVLDGEVVAFDEAERLRPFQQVSQRVGSRLDVASARAALPAHVRFFDVLSADGRDLADEPVRERHAALARIVPPGLRVRRLTLEEPWEPEQRAAAERFAEEALRDGREGVMVKGLDSAYSAGRRGASWLKVKPVHTLDLVVLAAEWGHGRRTGTLSNLHLGARGPDGFVMLGKTFKGLTDALLAWQTEHLQRIAESRPPWGVRVRPELVVEIAFDGLQRSTRYPAGVTLRFARVVRYRPEKPASEADTVDHVLTFARAP
ncbi:ATP-dependent DNA ligase [Streptomyces sp. HNM0574]|uniref:ATP-dependent DNA ligase n=1 Tax=Streptomyces sp. HNM0574 TaxID=2714954 RepID=UPI00146D1A4F|nr:ATP-dependent DNA ligase [Streptomyces sp. HNM0574]NLU69393.1 ATP-dependent DNA ligase [Streptomyces sp. HNM0574]